MIIMDQLIANGKNQLFILYDQVLKLFICHFLCITAFVAAFTKINDDSPVCTSKLGRIPKILLCKPVKNELMRDFLKKSASPLDFWGQTSIIKAQSNVAGIEYGVLRVRG